MRARWVIRGGLLLLGGAAVSVDVAWWSAAFVPPPLSTVSCIGVPIKGGEEDPFEHAAFVAQVRTATSTRRLAWVGHWLSPARAGGMAINWLPAMQEGWTGAGPGAVRPALPETSGEPWGAIPEFAAWAARATDDRSIPWSGASLPPRPPTPAAIGDIETSPMDDAHGWPMRCVWCSLPFNGCVPVVREPLGAIALSDWPATPGAHPLDDTTRFRALPCRPIWLGLAVDAIIYAALLGLLIGVEEYIRARRRARRGCCQACGYDLQGQTTVGCPECGAGRATSDTGPEVL